MDRTSAKARVAGRLRSATGIEELEARIAALEAEVRDYQSAHIRFAELVDLVQELLLPMADQDQDRIRAVIARYTDELDL